MYNMDPFSYPDKSVWYLLESSLSSLLLLLIVLQQLGEVKQRSTIHE